MATRNGPVSYRAVITQLIVALMVVLLLNGFHRPATAAPTAGDSNITIVAGSTDANITRTVTGGLATYAPNADTAQIGVVNINADLDAGLNVSILTTSVGTGTEAGNITVNAALVKSSGGDSNISITANNTIAVNANITNIGNGSTTLLANGNVSGNFSGITVDSSAISTQGTGTISLTGTGGSSGNSNNGIAFVGTSPQITSVNGDITLVGSTPSAGGSTNVGILSTTGIATTIQATGSGNVNLTGTSGGAEGGGIILHTTSTVQVATGDITIVGTGKFTACGFGVLGALTSTGSGNIDLTGTTDFGPDACMAGAFNSGPSGSFTVNANTVQIDASASVAGSGFLTFAPRTASTTIGLGGGAGTLNLTDAELTQLTDGFSSITIGKSDAGKITVDTATFNDNLTLLTAGDIADANDSGTDITNTGNTVTFNGNLSPGSSPGIFSVAGNVAFVDNSSFSVELTGTPSGGSHDQLDVTGSVTIGSSVALNLTTGSYTKAAGTITIVNNDGSADAVTGIFSGLAEGGQTNSGSNPNFLISYVGGDGNDVVLTATDPTAVQLVDFRAASDGNATLVWQTADESGLSGFHIWRGSAEKAETRLTDALIGASGGLNGGEYTWQDSVSFGWGQRSYYWLEAVEADSSTFAGPVEVLGIGHLFLPSVGR
ncbi:MAG: hypothetical protein KF753_18625 [Caldilineaceae bacterium]|nr:hypothetical protein [Caldilineaceae bacterium]